MATTPALAPSTPPTIPLTPEVRSAYDNLSAKYQAAFDANTDFAFRTEVLAWKTDVDNILEKDAMYQFNANTALFQALLVQIETTNLELDKIKSQLAAVAAHINTAAEVIGAIDKVLSLFP